MQKLLYLAQYVVNEMTRYGPVSPMKLQKLLYYVKAWGLVEAPALELVPGDFRKWKHGPVNPDVYQYFKTNGASQIQPLSVPGQFVPRGRQKELIDFIATSYAPLSAIELSVMTHREDPWRQAPDGAVIASNAMRTFYDGQYPFRQNFPYRPDREYVAVPSAARAAFTLDMPGVLADQLQTYPTFDAYRDHLARLRGLTRSPMGDVNPLLR